MTSIYLWIDTQHTGNIRGLNETLIKHLLPIVIEFIGDNSTLNSDGIIASFSNDSIDHFGVPPDP